MQLFADGAIHRPLELKAVLLENGYTKNSVSMTLRRLTRRGLLKKVGSGQYKINKK